MITPREVVRRRRAERQALLDVARVYVDGLDPQLDVRAAVVVGSVARGDFHVASDVDVIVVAERLPTDPAERWRRVASTRGIVQPIAWTVEEWAQQRVRGNPLRSTPWTTACGCAGRPTRFPDRCPPGGATSPRPRL
ncbi:MAG: nucleotidyltransferase domain-containing protein [Egibacteraceae bacterium]